MGPVLAPLFPPNSAKNAHLNSISRPRVMLFVTGEKVWESHDPSFMPVQWRAFSYPPKASFIPDFIIQLLSFLLIFPSIPGTSFPFFLSQPLQGPACHLCSPDLLPTAALLFGQRFIFTLYQPLLTWMYPSLIPQQATCKFHILPFFLANHRSSRQGQVVAPGWSVWLESPPACFRASRGATSVADAPTPRLPAPADPSWQIHRRLPLSCPWLCLFSTQTKAKRAKTS